MRMKIEGKGIPEEEEKSFRDLKLDPYSDLYRELSESFHANFIPDSLLVETCLEYERLKKGRNSTDEKLGSRELRLQLAKIFFLICRDNKVGRSLHETARIFRVPEKSLWKACSKSDLGESIIGAVLPSEILRRISPPILTFSEKKALAIKADFYAQKCSISPLCILSATWFQLYGTKKSEIAKICSVSPSSLSRTLKKIVTIRDPENIYDAKTSRDKGC